MSVDPAKAAGKVEHGGKAYYFCSKRCAERFAQEPETFLAELGTAGMEHAHTHGHAQTHPQAPAEAHVHAPIHADLGDMHHALPAAAPAVRPAPRARKACVTPARWIPKLCRLAREHARNAGWHSIRWMFSWKWRPIPSTTRCGGDSGSARRCRCRCSCCRCLRWVCG